MPAHILHIKFLMWQSLFALSRNPQIHNIPKFVNILFSCNQINCPDWKHTRHSHDGSGSIKVCIAPIRVICNNTLCMVLQTAKRSWSTRHTGDISDRMKDAKETLFRAKEYMDRLGKEIEMLQIKSESEEKTKDGKYRIEKEG